MDDVDIMDSIDREMLILKAKVIAINQVLDILGYTDDSDIEIEELFK